jgi:hypothetical protein
MQPNEPKTAQSTMPTNSRSAESHHRRPLVVIGVTIGIALFLAGLFVISRSMMNSNGSHW